MAWTAYDSMVRAVQLCGAFAPGEPPPAYIGQIGLDTLNYMRKSWNLEGVTCYGSSTIAITANGDTSYQLGTGGDSATYVPQVLQVQYENGNDPIVLERMTFEEYQAQPDKTATGQPCGWVDGGGYPAKSIYLYPPPSSGTIRIVFRTPFADVANLSDVMPDPPEYREAIDYGLALRLYMFPGLGGGEPPGYLASMANEALAKIKRKNAIASIPRKNMPSVYDNGTTGRGIIGDNW